MKALGGCGFLLAVIVGLGLTFVALVKWRTEANLGHSGDWRTNDRSQPKDYSTAMGYGFGALVLLGIPAAFMLTQIYKGTKYEQEDAQNKQIFEDALKLERSSDYQMGLKKSRGLENVPHPVVRRSGLLDASPGAIPLGFAYDGTPLQYAGDRHLLTIAPTGSGKNTSSQTPALMDYPGSAFVIDPKGQLAAITGRHRARRLGQAVMCLNPLGSLGLPSVAYNPLRHLDPKALTFAADCKQIAEGLVTVRDGNDSHWDNSALQLVELLIMWTVLHAEEKGYPKSLATVRQIIDLPDEMRVAFFIELQTSPRWEIATGAARYTLTDTEVRNCIQTAVVHLGFLRDEAIMQVLDGKRSGLTEISFADLKRRKQTVYLILPPERLHTHGRFLRLLVMSALGELYKERTRAEYPVLLMLDEFPALGKMPMIENVASIGRDYQLKLWLVAQNVPKLKDIYGDAWESLASAAGVKQFFRPDDTTTAGWLSARLGVTIEQFRTTTKSSGTSTGASGSGSSSSGESVAVGERERPLMRPQDIYAMADNSQVLVTSGLGSGLMAQRFPYWQHKRPDWLLTPDPYHNQTGFDQIARAEKWFSA